MRTSVLTATRCGCGRELYQDETGDGRCDDCRATAAAAWTVAQWRGLVRYEPAIGRPVRSTFGWCECCGADTRGSWVVWLGAGRAFHARLADCLATTRRGSL
jgi:hypothetical protein